MSDTKSSKVRVQKRRAAIIELTMASVALILMMGAFFWSNNLKDDARLPDLGPRIREVVSVDKADNATTYVVLVRAGVLFRFVDVGNDSILDQSFMRVGDVWEESSNDLGRQQNSEIFDETLKVVNSKP